MSERSFTPAAPSAPSQGNGAASPLHCPLPACALRADPGLTSRPGAWETQTPRHPPEAGGPEPATAESQGPGLLAELVS